MVDLKARAEENERINAELSRLPQAPHIIMGCGYVKGKDIKISEFKAQILALNSLIKQEEEEKEEAIENVRQLLLEVEAASGFSKMPLGDYGTVYLRDVAEGYEILDDKAVPEEYTEQVTSIKVVRKKIGDDVKAGKLKSNNWLKLKPAYKTVVISS